MLSAIYFWLFLLCINKSAIFHIETFFELCEPRKQWFSAEPQLELFGSTCHDLLEKCLLCYRDAETWWRTRWQWRDFLIKTFAFFLWGFLNIHDHSRCASDWGHCSVFPPTGIPTVRSGLWQVVHMGKSRERVVMWDALWDGPRCVRLGLPGCPPSAGMPLWPLRPPSPPALLFCCPTGHFLPGY